MKSSRKIFVDLLISCICAAALPVAARAQSESSRADIKAYQSSEEKHESLAEKPALTFQSDRAPALTIFVDDATKYQEIDGFGASLTESSAYLLKRKLTDAQRTEVLH